jgi:hypothetical protein
MKKYRIYWIVRKFGYFLESKCNLQIKEDKIKGIYVAGVSEMYVATIENMI